MAVTPGIAPHEPFFEQGAAGPDRPRLLLLSQHFPPGQAAGARRWEKLARFAAERGWGLDVFTLAPGDLAASDFTRLESLPEGTRVYGIAAREHWLSVLTDRVWSWLKRLRRSQSTAGSPSKATASAADVAPGWVKRGEVSYGLRSIAGWLRGYGAALEFANGAVWADDAARAALRVFDEGRHRAIVSCGPPHMVHRAARALSRRLGLALVIDMRDPWSLAERVHESVASRLWFRLAERFESRAFEQASLIVMNTPAARAAMCQKYPAHSDKLICVTNGFDDDVVSKPAREEAFVIAYAGSIYVDRSPRNLFRAVKVVADALDPGAAELRVELMGHFETDDITEMAEQEGVGARVTLHPPGSVRDVDGLLARAAMLVNLPQDSHLAIPSKIYEYMVYPAWLLALAEQGSATGQILAGTEAKVVHPDDVAGIARVIRGCHEAFERGVRPDPVASDARLGRAHQAALLLDALEERVGPAR